MKIFWLCIISVIITSCEEQESLDLGNKSNDQSPIVVAPTDYSPEIRTGKQFIPIIILFEC